MHSNTLDYQGLTVHHPRSFLMSSNYLSELLPIVIIFPISFLWRGCTKYRWIKSSRCNISTRKQDIATQFTSERSSFLRKRWVTVRNSQKASSWVSSSQCHRNQWRLSWNQTRGQSKPLRHWYSDLWSLMLWLWNENASKLLEHWEKVYSWIRNSIRVIRESRQSFKVPV